MNQMYKSKYKSGFYVRGNYSNPDEVSKSIEKNICYLKNYLKNYNSLEFSDIYIDNTDKDILNSRELFRLFKDIKLFEINCIIIKNLSEFEEVFSKLEKIITQSLNLYNIRFIAIENNIDSLRDSNEFIINEFEKIKKEYLSKKISINTKTEIRKKKNEGKYLSGRPPYGYIRDISNKYHLIPDIKTCEIVKEIYDMRASGKSKLSIAKFLNNKGIPSPENYRYQNNIVKSVKNVNSVWKERTINLILKNPVYTGRIFYGEANSFDELRNMPITHCEIIDLDLYIKVSEKALSDRDKWLQCHKNNRKETNKRKISNKIIMCGYCNSYLIKNKIKYLLGDENVYRCPNFTQAGLSICHMKYYIKEDSIFNVLNILISKLLLIYYKNESLNKNELEKKLLEEKEYLLQEYIYGNLSDEEYIKQKNIFNKKLRNIAYKPLNINSIENLYYLVKKIKVFNKSIIEINFDFKEYH